MASPTLEVAAREQELIEDVVEVSEGVGVEGVFLRRPSMKFTPLEIRLEKLRLRLRPNRGLCVWWSEFFLLSSFALRGPGRVLYNLVVFDAFILVLLQSTKLEHSSD